jgi:hypothetical protein
MEFEFGFECCNNLSLFFKKMTVFLF